jgi:hypothetical protein
MQAFTAGTYSWTVPNGVTSVIVEMWVGGGAGNLNLNGGHIGGAGGYGKGPVSVIPGSTIIITVGQGAPGVTTWSGGSYSNSSRNGGDTSFGGIVTATGGTSGTAWWSGNAPSGSSNCLLNCTSTTNVTCVLSVGNRYGNGSLGGFYPTSTQTANGQDGFLILIF